MLPLRIASEGWGFVLIYFCFVLLYFFTFIYLFVYCLCVCVCMHTMVHTWRRQLAGTRATMWVLRTELGLSGLVVSISSEPSLQPRALAVLTKAPRSLPLQSLLFPRVSACPIFLLLHAGGPTPKHTQSTHLRETDRELSIPAPDFRLGYQPRLSSLISFLISVFLK